MKLLSILLVALPPLGTLIIWFVVLLIVLAILYWIITLIPLDSRIKNIAVAIMLLIALLVILDYVGIL